MNRGIQLKQLRASDLGHLGIPYYLLGHPPTAIDEATFDDDASDRAPPLVAFGDRDLPDPRAINPLALDPLAITREVRRGLEQALDLLTQALPADCRPPSRRDD